MEESGRREQEKDEAVKLQETTSHPGTAAPWETTYSGVIATQVSAENKTRYELLLGVIIAQF